MACRARGAKIEATRVLTNARKGQIEAHGVAVPIQRGCAPHINERTPKAMHTCALARQVEDPPLEPPPTVPPVLVPPPLTAQALAVQ
jgi:hypothetical protein